MESYIKKESSVKQSLQKKTTAKDHPKYSFIIPVYNTEKYIKRCVESIQNQNFYDFEIILIDDGSTDNSLRICNILAQNDRRITIVHQENSGPGIARNLGIQYASGDYLIFVDSDDWWNGQTSLLKIDRIFSGKEDIDVVAFNALETYDDGVTLNQQPYFTFFSAIPKSYSSGVEFIDTVLKYKYDYAWFSWQYAFRRSLIVKNDIQYPEQKLGEDSATIYRILLEAQKVKILNQHIYVYRRGRTDSCTVIENYDKLVGIVNIARVCIDDINSREKLPDGIKKALCNNFATGYFIAMIRANGLGCDEKKKFIQLLKEEKGLMKYANSWKQIIVRRLTRCIGLKATVLLLGLRRKIREKY